MAVDGPIVKDSAATRKVPQRVLIQTVVSWRVMPVIMITTVGSQAKVMETVRRGAASYVRESFTAAQIKEQPVGLIKLLMVSFSRRCVN